MHKEELQPLAERKTLGAAQRKEFSPELCFATNENPMVWENPLSNDTSVLSEKNGTLGQANGSALVQASHPMLKLQRQYGNRYIQRAVDLMRKEEEKDEVSHEVEAAINKKRGGDRALDSHVRSQMETAFGADFRGVRVHTDTEANTLNRELNARAFTTGKDIFFRGGEYSPENPDGRKLLAHELTHIMQQENAQVSQKLQISTPLDASEREADQVSQDMFHTEQQGTMLRGFRSVHSVPVSLQRRTFKKQKTTQWMWDIILEISDAPEIENEDFREFVLACEQGALMAMGVLFDRKKSPVRRKDMRKSIVKIRYRPPQGKLHEIREEACRNAIASFQRNFPPLELFPEDVRPHLNQPSPEIDEKIKQIVERRSLREKLTIGTKEQREFFITYKLHGQISTNNLADFCKYLKRCLEGDKETLNSLERRVVEDPIKSTITHLLVPILPPSRKSWALCHTALDAALEAANALDYGLSLKHVQRAIEEYNTFGKAVTLYRESRVWGGEAAKFLTEAAIILLTTYATGGAVAAWGGTKVGGQLITKALVNSLLKGTEATSKKIGSRIRGLPEDSWGKVGQEIVLSFFTKLLDGALTAKFLSKLTPAVMRVHPEMPILLPAEHSLRQKLLVEFSTQTGAKYLALTIQSVIENHGLNLPTDEFIDILIKELLKTGFKARFSL